MARRVRYFFSGEAPSDGRVLSVAPEKASVSHLLNLLSSFVDTTLFVPHVFCGEEDAFVPLDSFANDSLPIGIHPNGSLDVRLHPASRPVPGSAGLLCDSASASDLGGGFFGVGIVRGSSARNHGTVWRTALQLGAAFTFTVGTPYSRKVEGSADLYKTSRQIPCISYADEDALAAAGVVGADWVAVEYGGEPLSKFVHPRRAMYLLGAERGGLAPELVARCRYHVTVDVVPGRPASMNVAAAAAVVLWDRTVKERQGHDAEPTILPGDTPKETVSAVSDGTSVVL